jgi:hypothetical protein
MAQARGWAGIKSVTRVEREAERPEGSGGKDFFMRRRPISSASSPPWRTLGMAIRRWMAEIVRNMLDAAFKEDDRRMMKGRRQERLSILRKPALIFIAPVWRLRGEMTSVEAISSLLDTDWDCLKALLTLRPSEARLQMSGGRKRWRRLRRC